MDTDKKIVVAYIGGVVPDTQEYQVLGYVRAGNLAQNGFVEALHHSGLILDKVYSLQPIAGYPRCNVLLKRGKRELLSTGVSVSIVPLINIIVIRDIFRALWVYASVLVWSLINIRRKRIVVIYNLGVPPVVPLYWVCKMLKTKLVPIFYDVVAPESLGFNLLRSLLYGWIANSGLKHTPHFDGRIVITDAIAERFASGCHFVRIDGGLTDLVIKRLFPLHAEKSNDRIQREDLEGASVDQEPHLPVIEDPNMRGVLRAIRGDGSISPLILLFAGGISEWNHIPLMLNVLKKNPELNIQLWIAGEGPCLVDVLAAGKEDERVIYQGSLSHDQLFELYQKADVLLNLRNTNDPSMAYAFPSKLLEILAVGKLVITTPIAHAKLIYGDYCFMLEDETEDKLCVLIEQIQRMPAKERLMMGIRAREYMLREHTWKAQGKKIRAYLEEVVLNC